MINKLSKRALAKIDDSIKLKGLNDELNSLNERYNYLIKMVRLSFGLDHGVDDFFRLRLMKTIRSFDGSVRDDFCCYHCARNDDRGRFWYYPDMPSAIKEEIEELANQDVRDYFARSANKTLVKANALVVDIEAIVKGDESVKRPWYRFR